MIGFYFTSVTHDETAINDARQRWLRVAGHGSDEWFIASPACNYPGAPDHRHREVSLFAGIAEGSLGGAMVVAPVRLFQDNYSRAFIGLIHRCVRPGGLLLLPYHEDKSAKQTGYWSVDWLRNVVGSEEHLHREDKLFQLRCDSRLPAVKSVLAAVATSSDALAQAFLAERDRAGSRAYLRSCEEFIALEHGCAASLANADSAMPDLRQDLEKFLAYVTYSVTGASYKTEAIRRMIGRYLSGRDDLRIVNIGGGMGFVDVELLLTCPAVARLVNCEPIAASLPITRALFERFRSDLLGRYQFALSTAQDYPFAQPCDVICEFAALLYVPRDQLRATLDRAWAALRPGGILMIHENIKRPLFRGKSYYDMIFTVEELERYLSCYGPIDYFRSSDLAPMKQSDTKDLTIFRVVQKGR
jgi:SAM-dependent methyltransferase